MRIAALIIGIILLTQPSEPRYVAPYGAGGECSADAPCSLTTALTSGGDIWLLPGTYPGAWNVAVANTTLRSVPGTRARLDGRLRVSADDVTIDGLEITNTSWLTRTSAYPNAPVPDLPQSTSDLGVFGKRARILRNHIHDLGLQGIGAWTPGQDAEIAYNLVWNNGWQGSDRGHGPAIYAQNQYGEKWIHDNVLLPGYNKKTFEIYGSSLAYVRNFRIERNVHIGGQYLIGEQGTVPDRTDAITITDNLLWNVPKMEIGYTNRRNGRATVTGNYLGLSHMQATYWRDLQVSGNTMIRSNGQVLTLQPPITATVTMNTYYHTGAASPFVINGLPHFSWAKWQQAGYDAGSTFTQALPTQNKIFVRSWGPHHGVVVIYNWLNSAAVSVDLSALGLTNGAIYHLTNAQNPAERLAFVAGSPVSIPMSGWTVATPIAAAVPLATFDPRFATFLVEP